MQKRLRIGLVLFGSRGWMGGDEYIRNLVFALRSLPREAQDAFELFLLSYASDRDAVRPVEAQVEKVYSLREELGSAAPWTRACSAAVGWAFGIPQYQLDRFLKKNRFDFVYPYSGAGRWPAFRNFASWIPDFQHKHLPQYFTKQEIDARDRNHLKASQGAPAVVMSSRNAEQDFRAFYPELAHKARLLTFRSVPQASWYAPDPAAIQRKYNLPDKFFIVSNQFWQHKNHPTVFNALKLLKDRGVHPVVVCTGHIYDRRLPEYADTILRTIHALDIGQQVYLLGLIPKLDQIQLLRRSIAVIQPSLFEGWSTVVEEARSLGKPALLSDFPVHLEQDPPGSRFFERLSPESLADLMSDTWKNLSPGPDLGQESAARKKSVIEIWEFANTFLDIARSNTRN